MSRSHHRRAPAASFLFYFDFATCDPSLTGRVTTSLPLLRELGREVRSLDGRSVVEVGR